MKVEFGEESCDLYLTFTTEGLPNIIAKKVAGIVEELNSEVINVESLKAYLAVGVPD
jgi:hypothetical protein